MVITGLQHMLSLNTWNVKIRYKVNIYVMSLAHSIFYTLWPSDAIWLHKSGSPLVQEMACSLMAPSHCLNQCCLMIKGILWHTPESNFTRSEYVFNPQHMFENNNFETNTTPRTDTHTHIYIHMKICVGWWIDSMFNKIWFVLFCLVLVYITVDGGFFLWIYPCS